MDNYGNAYAQDAAGSQLGQAVAQQQLNEKKPASIRERVCGSARRAENILSVLSNLTREVEPPSALAGVASGSMNETQVDPTLISDLDDLGHMLSRIETQVLRLSITITGAA